MDPITNEEMLMAAAAGEYDVELPTPITRPEQYWVKIINRINSGGGGSVSPEQIDAAIESYLNSHDADIVTEQELSDELSGYYNKTDIDNALDGKADVADIPDVSSFIDADVDNLTNYYDKNDVDDALSGKADANHNHSGVYAPASHSHTQADVTGLDSALAGKAAASHTHAQADVTGLADALAAKADAAATQTALNAKQDALTAGENITIETVNGELTISATDTDTWVPNSSGAAGYVASGEGQANKAWMTDENGNPAWRAASAPTDAQVQTAVYRYLENENLEEMVQTSGGAMTPDIKRALLDAFAHVAWADANGLTYYNTLETALFPNLNLVSISAVYTQTKPIYTDNSLDDLRSELVVTANYSNSSSEVVSFYTLTGTLNAGTRAITVTYGGKTATFQVVVTPENVWISALGNGGHSAQPAYSPFVLPSSTYQYDYSKEITAIELNVITAGQLSIGYCTQSTLSGTYSYSDSVFVTHEVLSTVKAGTQKIRLQTPLTIPSGYTLFFGVPTDTMDFDYGGTFTNGFYYHNLSTDKWAVQNRTIGMNIYTA